MRLRRAYIASAVCTCITRTLPVAVSHSPHQHTQCDGQCSSCCLDSMHQRAAAGSGSYRCSDPSTYSCRTRPGSALTQAGGSATLATHSMEETCAGSAGEGSDYCSSTSSSSSSSSMDASIAVIRSPYRGPCIRLRKEQLCTTIMLPAACGVTIQV